jgi:hypothetical protein
MDCRHVERRIDAYLDRELDAGSAEALAAHVGRCADCGRRWGALLTLLENPRPVEVPTGLRERILAQLQVELTIRQPSSDRPAATAPASGGRGGSRMRMNWLRYPLAAAACAAFFVGGWLLSGLRQQGPVPMPGDGGLAGGPVNAEIVMLSPWMLSSMAQAARLPAPVNPAVVLAAGIMPEALAVPSRASEPMIRVYEGPAAPASRPAEQTAPPVWPIVPRYLGA